MTRHQLRPVLFLTGLAVILACGWLWARPATGERPGKTHEAASVAVSGLCVSPLLTLYITPVVYLYLEKLQGRFSPAPLEKEA